MKAQLLDADAVVRRAGVERAASGMGSSGATSLLIPLLWDPDMTVRHLVIQKLGEVGDERAAWALRVWQSQAERVAAGENAA